MAVQDSPAAPAQFRDIGILPLSCPTCQAAVANGRQPPATLHGVVFDVLAARPPRCQQERLLAHIRLATSSSITSVAPPPIVRTRASRTMRSIAVPRMKP